MLRERIETCGFDWSTKRAGYRPTATDERLAPVEIPEKDERTDSDGRGIAGWRHSKHRSPKKAPGLVPSSRAASTPWRSARRRATAVTRCSSDTATGAAVVSSARSGRTSPASPIHASVAPTGYSRFTGPESDLHARPHRSEGGSNSCAAESVVEMPRCPAFGPDRSTMLAFAGLRWSLPWSSASGADAPDKELECPHTSAASTLAEPLPTA